MDINTLRGLSTVFVMIAFFGICWWAYSPSRKKGFNDAANLPFADEENHAGAQKDLHVSASVKTGEEKQHLVGK